MDYLQEYFPHGVDNEPIIKFIIEESQRLPFSSIVIDVGSGPTVCYWAAIAPYTKGVYISDYLKVNLKEIDVWVKQEPGMYDWTDYVKLMLKYENTIYITTDSIKKRNNICRSKVLGYYKCDIRKTNPLGHHHRGMYDCVISVCCADSITNSKRNWREYMKNIFSLLKPKGFFIGAAMKNCTHYNIGDLTYPSANLNEEDFKNLFYENNFDMNSLRITAASESRLYIDNHKNSLIDLRYEYDQLILASGFIK